MRTENVHHEQINFDKRLNNVFNNTSKRFAV